jgi:hypothetical protein
MSPNEVLRETVTDALSKSMTYFVKAGPFIGPRGGKWADAKHTIPWKEKKGRKPRAVKAKTKKKPAKVYVDPKLRIVGIVSVVDTREREEVGDRWVPIPGSGIQSVCARCAKEHEVHAEVELSDGTTRVMGTGCARQQDPEVASRIKSLESAAKTLGKNLHALGVAKVNLEKQRAVNAAAAAEVDKLVQPEMRLLTKEETAGHFGLRPNTEVWAIGDAFARTHKPTDDSLDAQGRYAWEKRKRDESLPWNWRRKRLDEHGHKSTTSLEMTVKDLERRVQRLQAKKATLEAEKLGETKKSMQVMPLLEYVRRRRA